MAHRQRSGSRNGGEPRRARGLSHIGSRWEIDLEPAMEASPEGLADVADIVKAAAETTVPAMEASPEGLADNRRREPHPLDIIPAMEASPEGLADQR